MFQWCGGVGTSSDKADIQSKYSLFYNLNIAQMSSIRNLPNKEIKCN